MGVSAFRKLAVAHLAEPPFAYFCGREYLIWLLTHWTGFLKEVANGGRVARKNGRVCRTLKRDNEAFGIELGEGD